MLHRALRHTHTHIHTSESYNRVILGICLFGCSSVPPSFHRFLYLRRPILIVPYPFLHQPHQRCNVIELSLLQNTWGRGVTSVLWWRLSPLCYAAKSHREAESKRCKSLKRSRLTERGGTTHAASTGPLLAFKSKSHFYVKTIFKKKKRTLENVFSFWLLLLSVPLGYHSFHSTLPFVELHLIPNIPTFGRYFFRRQRENIWSNLRHCFLQFYQQYRYWKIAFSEKIIMILFWSKIAQSYT